jgi:hypothetical protein
MSIPQRRLRQVDPGREPHETVLTSWSDRWDFFGKTSDFREEPRQPIPFFAPPPARKYRESDDRDG